MERILRDTISDLVGSFLYYDRKEDEELPPGAIQEMMEADPALLDEIIDVFRAEILSGRHG